MKTCVIVDDEDQYIRTIKRYISKRKDIVCVNSFTNPRTALTYLQQNQIDIIILDIEMPTSGLLFRKKIPKESVIIFITNSTLHAAEAFNQNAIDYILKPIKSSRLHWAIDKAILFINAVAKKDILSHDKQVVLTLKSNRKIYKVPANDITYIESLKEYVCYHTKTEKIIALGTLKDVFQGLPTESFIRIHKSFIVHRKCIVNYNNSSLTLNNGENFTVGRTYKKSFVRMMEQ